VEAGERAEIPGGKRPRGTDQADSGGTPDPGRFGGGNLGRSGTQAVPPIRDELPHHVEGEAIGGLAVHKVATDSSRSYTSIKSLTKLLFDFICQLLPLLVVK